jgi:hypothetical protein
MAQRVTLDGTVRGHSIDLDGETGIPDGTRVQVTVEAPSLSLEEKRAIIDRLAGVWANGAGIVEICKEIEAERQTRMPRLEG